MNFRSFRDYALFDILQFVGLSGMAVGLVFGKAILSISLLFTILILLIRADFKLYWKELKSSRFIHILGLYFLFHFLTLLWSDNLPYGLHEIKVRSSLLLIILCFVCRPLDRNLLNWILLIFVLSILLATALNFSVYFGLIGERSSDDIRGMSMFGSHVRFALLVIIGIIICFQFWREKYFHFVLPLIAITWLLTYTYFSQVITGYIGVAVVMFFLTARWIYQWRKWASISFVLSCIAGIIVLVYFTFRPIYPEQKGYNNLPFLTEEGNPYYHKGETIQPETGEYIEIMVCWEELEREWNKVSEIPFIGGRDAKGQFIESTAIRYLSSKGLNRDAKGFRTLSKKDIKNIEDGHASQYTSGLMARWYGIRYQIVNKVDPNGHSLLERLEFWKAGGHIARTNLIGGVGIGDIQDAFNDYYNETNSPLQEDNRNRSHNMFLSTLIGMGVFGLFLFIWLHAQFLQEMIYKGSVSGILFVVLLLVTYLIEDTLETQVGVSLTAFFLGLFLVFPNESRVSR